MVKKENVEVLKKETGSFEQGFFSISLEKKNNGRLTKEDVQLIFNQVRASDNWQAIITIRRDNRQISSAQEILDLSFGLSLEEIKKMVLVFVERVVEQYSNEIKKGNLFRS